MKRSVYLVPIFIVLLFAACNRGNGEIEVIDAWARVSPAAAENSAFYMTIRNRTGEDVVLIGAATDACEVVELHETILDQNGVMSMQPVTGGVLPIQAGEDVTMGMGGLHLMCLRVTKPFELGEEVPLTLRFDGGRNVDVMVEIREEAP